MRISTKGRYGLGVMLKLAMQSETIVPISSLSKELGLSKIYLEQVLRLLKSGGLVHATKGPQGGYGISDRRISIKEILEALEPALFAKTDRCCDDDIIDNVLFERVFNPMQEQLNGMLETLFLSELSQEVDEKRLSETMFYI